MSRNKYSPSNNIALPSIFATVFCGKERDHWVHPTLTTELMRMAFGTLTGHYHFSYHPTFGIHPISHARNKFIDRSFLPSDCEWAMMWDNDIEPPEGVIESILTAPPEADIIILPYWVWNPENLRPMLCAGQWETTPTGKKMIATDFATSGWHQIGAGGTGALFVRRRVFTEGKLTRPWFKIIYADNDYDEQAMSEDIWFTSRATEAGYRIFTHTDFICGHHRTMNLAEVNLGMTATILAGFDIVRKQYGERGITVPSLNDLLGMKVRHGVWIEENGITRCPNCQTSWRTNEETLCHCENNLALAK